jgi:dehydrogenase/reductase SDR family protein 4
MKEQFDLKGKVAIITGSSKGIGAAMAHGLAEHGAKVIVSSRDQAAVDAVAAEIKKAGYEATGIACHVGDEEQLAQLVEKTIAAYGGVDILINNAAINPTFGPLADTELGAFDKIMHVNLRSCFILANLCFASMKERGGGSIINIASVEGLKPSQGLGPYSISKAALIMLSKSQAKEWGAFGIRSNAVCPGLVQTKLSAGLWQNEKILDSITKHLPAGRMAQPDEMTGLAVFLASNAASYCTGGVYTADGGYMIA